jgi:hypothetical protein
MDPTQAIKPEAEHCRHQASLAREEAKKADNAEYARQWTVFAERWDALADEIDLAGLKARRLARK